MTPAMEKNWEKLGRVGKNKLTWVKGGAVFNFTCGCVLSVYWIWIQLIMTEEILDSLQWDTGLQRRINTQALNETCQQTHEKRKEKKRRKSSNLYNIADDLGKHAERKPEDVKERERHKGLLRIQDVVLIHSHIHSKRCHGNLDTHGQTGLSDNMVHQFTVEMYRCHTRIDLSQPVTQQWPHYQQLVIFMVFTITDIKCVFIWQIIHLLWQNQSANTVIKCCHATACCRSWKKCKPKQKRRHTHTSLLHITLNQHTCWIMSCFSLNLWFRSANRQSGDEKRCVMLLDICV